MKDADRTGGGKYFIVTQRQQCIEITPAFQLQGQEYTVKRNQFFQLSLSLCLIPNLLEINEESDALVRGQKQKLDAGLDLMFCGS